MAEVLPHAVDNALEADLRAASPGRPRRFPPRQRRSSQWPCSLLRKRESEVMFDPNKNRPSWPLGGRRSLTLGKEVAAISRLYTPDGEESATTSLPRSMNAFPKGPGWARFIRTRTMTRSRVFSANEHGHCDDLFAEAENAVGRPGLAARKSGFQSFVDGMRQHFSHEEDVLFPAFETRPDARRPHPGDARGTSADEQRLRRHASTRWDNRTATATFGLSETCSC